MDPATKIDRQPWMTSPATTRVMASLRSTGVPARFVGGCVRDALLGRPVKDVDIATPLPPQDVTRLLQRDGLRVVPTGVEHGTVMAVVDGAHFEVTTLRVDVETYGRRAKVAFTDDWTADAARRDFTINALSCSPDGEVYDPFGGIADLQAGRVTFVGEPEERIREDVLRLLRFYRFQAYYGRTAPDAAARAACAKLAPLLPTLSGERLAQETLRLLDASDPASALRLMAADGVLAHYLPEATRIDRLAGLVTVEGAGVGADPLRRLAALLAADTAGAAGATGTAAVADRLRLSNAARARLIAMAGGPGGPDGAAFGPDMPMPERRRRLYRLGAPVYRDLVLLAWAEAVAAGEAEDTTAAWRTLVDLAATWPPPRFPLGGHDALRLGAKPGPQVGEQLAAVEAWWVDGDFKATRKACLARLAEQLASRDGT